MKQRKRVSAAILILLSALAAATGCSSKPAQSPQTGDPAKPGSTAPEELTITEPVTLKLYSHYAAINTPNDVDALFGTVKKKHPNINIELIKGTKLSDMIAAGEVPDLIATTHFYMNDLLPLGVASDMNDFVKKYRVDLSKFEPQAINAIKSYGKNGELYGIPYTLNYGVLIYNKDIFDRFGVPYPTDGMTWDQITELSKRLTREENGIQYLGFDPGSERTFSRGYSLGTVNDKGAPIFDTEGYKKTFGLLKQMYEIPGYIDPKNKFQYGVDYFMKDQKLAMFPSWLAAITSRLPQLNEGGNGFNWDVVGHPVFDDKPGVGREIEFQSLMVPPTSKNKEAAYRVILTMISEESQKEMNKGNNLTILNDPELKKQFASNTDIYKGKNLEGIFKVKPAIAPINSEYDNENYKYLREALTGMIFDKKDINTVLREANEKAAKYIQSEQARKK
ncbi:ABC transporter substrate-binding protein [Paenibacillus sp. OAS669]|uniref:ABC transporter substrate-binding protein n=1 Tax=Paenibacillus sp. OAS669 TaxID=2663821 RepID=UPI00178B1743|nr:extracellular solute-binding protein [Paenibacillus sp. OAS669]MBE1442059.1 multiple sugar transport system substrate-binding protein [Paenibacillus sp. OAS669]